MQLPSEPFWAQAPPAGGRVVVVVDDVVVVGAFVVDVVAGALVVLVVVGTVDVVDVVGGGGGAGAGAGGRHAASTRALPATVTRRSGPRRMACYRHPGATFLNRGGVKAV